MRTVIGPQWILTITTGMMLILGVSIMVLDLTGAGLWGTVIPLWFFITTLCGFSFPVQVIALNGHGQEAGRPRRCSVR